MNKQEILDYLEAKIVAELDQANDKEFMKLLLKVAEMRPDVTSSLLEITPEMLAFEATAESE